jgi:hypothetical protein
MLHHARGGAPAHAEISARLHLTISTRHRAVPCNDSGNNVSGTHDSGGTGVASIQRPLKGKKAKYFGKFCYSKAIHAVFVGCDVFWLNNVLNFGHKLLSYGVNAITI